MLKVFEACQPGKFIQSKELMDRVSKLRHYSKSEFAILQESASAWQSKDARQFWVVFAGERVAVFKRRRLAEFILELSWPSAEVFASDYDEAMDATLCELAHQDSMNSIQFEAAGLGLGNISCPRGFSSEALFLRMTRETTHPKKSSPPVSIHFKAFDAAWKARSRFLASKDYLLHLQFPGLNIRTYRFSTFTSIFRHADPKAFKGFSAWDGERVVGAFAWKETAEDLAYGHSLWVCPTAQGKGVGRHLMHLVCTKALKAKSVLEIATSVTNPVAISLYLSHGASIHRTIYSRKFPAFPMYARRGIFQTT
jgi:GNAT superfamily N-acetyltransferase